MRGATEYHTAQPLTAWKGDVGTLITEMKRRAGVRTDQDLARFVGFSQSTVSNWRKRGAVPEAALLQFEEVLERAGADRLMAARAIALAVPEAWYQKVKERQGEHSRGAIYSWTSLAMHTITHEIARNLERIEVESGKSANSLIGVLIEDRRFLDGIVNWLLDTPVSELLARELRRVERAQAALRIP